MLLRCYLGPLNIVNFQNFASLRPDISKTGGRTKNFVCTQNLLKVVKNTLEPKKLQFFFFTTLHKILPFCQKMTTGPISCTGFFQSLLIVESVSRKKPCPNSLFNRT